MEILNGALNPVTRSRVDIPGVIDDTRNSGGGYARAFCDVTDRWQARLPGEALAKTTIPGINWYRYHGNVFIIVQ